MKFRSDQGVGMLETLLVLVVIGVGTFVYFDDRFTKETIDQWLDQAWKVVTFSEQQTIKRLSRYYQAQHGTEPEGYGDLIDAGLIESSYVEVLREKGISFQQAVEGNVEGTDGETVMEISRDAQGEVKESADEMEKSSESGSASDWSFFGDSTEQSTDGDDTVPQSDTALQNLPVDSLTVDQEDLDNPDRMEQKLQNYDASKLEELSNQSDEVDSSDPESLAEGLNETRDPELVEMVNDVAPDTAPVDQAN